MTREKRNSKSDSFLAAAEEVCLQPVLEHRQRRGRRNVAGQAIPHLCSSNRKGTTSGSWATTGRNIKLFSGGGPEPASVRHVGDTCEWRRQVRWCGTMQCTIRQRRHIPCGGVVNNQIKKCLLLNVSEKIRKVYCWVWKCKNFWNRWIFGKITSKIVVVSCTLRAWPTHC